VVSVLCVSATAAGVTAVSSNIIIMLTVMSATAICKEKMFGM
jgi:hypothetical protein